MLIDSPSFEQVRGEEAGVFLFYLIDPVRRSVEKVSDGFDRAAGLTNSEAPELDTLWADAPDPDSSVNVAYDPDAGGQPAFRLRLSHRGNTTERVFAGRGVLMACGAVPGDIAQQGSTTEAVQFPCVISSAVVAEEKHASSPSEMKKEAQRWLGHRR
ncbi:hypothetical protein BZM27_34570 [Paraburkholderia steynii]|uniref:Uncharacterized protein n=1 Tax=Paraburkholderia steynii TaxID=1245441 RepID=A0A4V2NGK7_9BURK|nr:hypothetical protein BZM27_34570 [Paraburkholderia steynii]